MSGIGNERRASGWHEVWYRARSAFAVLLSLAVLAGGAWFVYDRAAHAWTDFRTADDYLGAGVNPIRVTIPNGATLYQISDILVAADVVKSAKTFDIACAQNPKSQGIQPGIYNMKSQMSAQDALAALLDTTTMAVIKVTLIEGQRLTQQLAQLEKARAKGGTGYTKAQYDALLKDPLQVAKLGLPAWAGGKPEGFFFPDTYRFADDGRPISTLQAMVARFKQVAAAENIVGGAAALKRTPYELLTVASIVEAEVRRPEDRAKVARVIYNRLGAGMALGMDSTVHYAVGKDGSVTTTDADRASKSPYNTYLVQGLPPGPIGAPGQASIDAAVHPADGAWLYFTTVNLKTGETLFENTAAEHETDVAVFQQWCADNPNSGC